MLLPIKYNEETKVDISLCACVDDRSLPWFYENYINLIVREGVYLCAEFEDCLHPDFSLTKSIRINSFSSFSSAKEYLLFIKNRIDNGYYLSSYFYTWHQADDFSDIVYENVSYILIYGYDDSENKIFFLMHDTVKGVIECAADISYFGEMFDKLTERGEDVFSPAVRNAFLLEVTFNDIFKNRRFHIKIFLDNLNRYIFSLKKFDNDIVGLNVYDEYIKVLKDQSMPIVFRGLENLAKHKKFLLKRFNYIKGLYKVSEEYERLLLEYNNEVVLPVERIKLLSMKYGICSQGGLIFLSDNSSFRTDIADKLFTVRECERNLLTAIYAEIKNICSREGNHSFYLDFSFSIQDVNTVKVVLKESQYLTGIDLVDMREKLSYAAPARVVLDNGDIHYIHDSSVSGIRLRECRFKPVSVKSFCIYQDELSYMEKNSVQLNVLPSEYCWKKVLLQEWNAIQQFSEINYGENIECSVYNNNPYFVMDGKYINADVSKYVYIKYETLSDSEAAQVWFVAEKNENFFPDKLKTFTIKPGKGMVEYKIDMSNTTKWKGMIGRLRFDPIHYDHSGTAEIKINSIRICDEMPIYNNDDFCGTQGVNGWFYYSYNGDITYREMEWNDTENEWIGINNSELKVGKDFQTSSKQFSSVRRWVCPASGTYLVKIYITPISECSAASFKVLKNFSTRVFFVESLNRNSEYSAEREVVLERGEYVFFEFFNLDELSIESVQTSYSILKVKGIE